MNTCVLVLGVGRSGTSAVAGALHHLGVEMGPFGDPEGPAARRANPRGYFEKLALVGFHQQFVGRRLDQLPPEEPVELSFQWRLNYLSVIQTVNDRPLWGAKDTRTACFLGEFLAVAPGRFRVRVVRVGRDKGAVLRSLAAYPAPAPFDPAEFYGRWKPLVDGAVALARRRGCPVLDVQYERLVADPAGEVGRLARFVGLEPTPAAVGFIDPALDRNGDGRGRNGKNG